MSDRTFPAFNFPFTPSVDIQQSLCDYGRTGLLAIFKDDSGATTYIPQRKKHKSNRTFKFRTTKPSLPLKLPNEVCHKFSFDAEADKKQRHPDQLFNYKRRNMQTLSTDYEDIFFGGFVSVFGEDACGLRAKPSTEKSKRNLSVTILDDMFCDIPAQLLDKLLDQSYEEELFTFNGGYYSNCLNYQYTGNGTDDIILTYPSGMQMDTLSLSLGSFSKDGSLLSLTPEIETYQFPHKIYQISSVNELRVNPLIAVRSNYSCGIFCCEFNQDGHFKVPNLKHLGNLPCKTQPCSVLVNPYIPGEVVIVMETGSVHLWNEKNASLEMMKKSSACSPEEFNWYFCEFGAHPRQIVRGSKSVVELVDFRTSLSTDRELLTLPSPHFFKDDQFSTVQRHPENPYHYFVGSKQFLVVMDERFAQTPVLKWCHSLLGPIKHINVTPNALPDSKDTLLVVGDYKNHEVHCYQYCYGDQIPDGQTVMATKGGMPPCPTSNPWKISSYIDWPDVVDFPDKPECMSVFKRKLDVPLIGLTSIHHKENLSILQLSKEGDLFYQALAPEITSLVEERDQGRAFFYEERNNSNLVNFDQNNLNLPKNEQKLVKNWIQDIKQDSQESNLSAVSESEFSYFDVNDFREKGLLNSNFPSHCALCEQSITKTGDEVISELCCHCQIDKNISDKLARILTNPEPVILTNSYLDIKYTHKELRLFNESGEYIDPLGNVLLKNWHSDVPTPIDLSSLKNEETENLTTVWPANNVKQKTKVPARKEKTTQNLEMDRKSNDGKEAQNLSQNKVTTTKMKLSSRVAGF